MVENQRSFFTGLFYLTFGAGTAFVAWGYDIGTLYNMGSGFFPFSVGVALVLVGLSVLAGSFGRSGNRETIGKWPIKSLALILLAVVLFGVLLEPAGLVVAIPVLLGVSFYAHPDFNWKELLFLVVLLLPFSLFVFVYLLGLNFPLLPTVLTQ